MREIAARTAELEAANARVGANRGDAHCGISRQRRFARTILNTAHDAFVAMNGHGQIMEWNRQAEDIFGWRRDEVLGKKLVEMIVPHSSAKNIGPAWKSSW